MNRADRSVFNDPAAGFRRRLVARILNFTQTYFLFFCRPATAVLHICFLLFAFLLLYLEHFQRVLALVFL
jgi:hypothetical protein